MTTDSKWALIGSMAASLAVGACSGAAERPLQSNFQNGGGSSQGSMAYPTPAPQGNLSTTPVR